MAKRKGSGRGRLILLLLAAAALVLYLTMSEKDGKAPTAPQQLYEVQKTGAGSVVDYTSTAKRVHGAVDKGLTGAKLSGKTIQETQREVPRQTVEGLIRWQARQVAVAVPDGTKPEAVEQALSSALKGSGGEVLASQADTFQGVPVIRIDVGIRDTLEGDPLTLITDRVYVTKQGKGEIVPAKPTGAGQMAIIIDDFGYSGEAISAFAGISRPLTFAVLPGRAYTGEAASRGISSGHQVMLHLPLEPLSAAEQSEASTITVGMSDQEIQQAVAKAIRAVPGIIGVNNHQGSKATADKRVMKNVFTVLKANNLFFVDSRTSSGSVAYDLSRQSGLRTGENEMFLDNSNDVEYVKGRLRSAKQMALQSGSVTVIGHARLTTAQAIREMIPELDAAGVKLVFVSQLVR